MVPISGKVEWKSTSLEHGALLLTLIGLVMMHKLSVASWDISNQVPKSLKGAVWSHLLYRLFLILLTISIYMQQQSKVYSIPMHCDHE